MIAVMEDDINPILSKYDYPNLKVKIGIAEGKMLLSDMGMIKVHK